MKKLDRIDINILGHLQDNGRLSNVELADTVGLSPSPCLQRVKRLEKAGYIESYNAKIALAKLSELVVVFTEVTLQDHRREDFVRFEREIKRCESLQECHLISGGYDYLLKFVTQSVLDYQQIIEGILEKNIGLEKYFSYIVIKSVVNRGSIPVRAVLPKE